MHPELVRTLTADVACLVPIGDILRVVRTHLLTVARRE
jgi:hypothetical protein